MRIQDKSTVLFSGYAKIPKDYPYYGDATSEIGCVIEVDMDSHQVVNCEFGVLKSLTNDFLRRVIVGYDLNQGIEGLAVDIRKRCQLVSKNAIIKALDVAYSKYVEYKLNA
jgi:hypothetical protein